MMPVPGAAPVGQTTPPGQPAFGPSPQMSSPVPNQGHQAAGMAIMSQAIRLLEKALPMLGAESDAGREVLSALGRLAKHLPAGSTSPGVEMSSLQKLLMEQRQQNPMMALMRQQQQGGGVAPPPGQGQP